jgi:hypothetical protein
MANTVLSRRLHSGGSSPLYSWTTETVGNILDRYVRTTLVNQCGVNLFVESTRQQPLTHTGYERIDAWLHPRELWMKNVCGKCEPQRQPKCCTRSHVRCEKVQHFSPGVWFYLARDVSNVRSTYTAIGKKPGLPRLPLAWQVCAAFRPYYQRYHRQCRRKSWQYLRALHRRTLQGHPLQA